MNDAFILAAGFGTRLRPLTLSRPKPLVPVCGVPMLSYALALCAAHGLKHAIVNAHYLSEQLQEWEGEHEGVLVTVAVEQPEILGTGGGLKHVAHQLAERFVVVNGDVLNDVDLASLLASVPTGGAAMALRPLGPDQSYRVVATDSTGCVIEMVDLAAAPAQGAADHSTHFTGVHALHRSVLDRVPEGFADIVRTAYIELLQERLLVGRRHEGLWLDVGDPAAYLDTNLAILSGEVPTVLDPLPRAGWARRGGYAQGEAELVQPARVEDDAWIGEGAVLGVGTRIQRSIVGHGARLAQDTHLSECVVWDGVEVAAGSYERCILHPLGVLHVR
jgi:NDP-sugar pyrophosphorylase family protein